MKFVDSNVLVYAFSNTNRTDSCIQLLKEENLIINTLVLVELYAKLCTIVDQNYAQFIVRNLFKKDNLRIVPLDNNLLFESIKRQQKYKKLKIADLLHFTAAMLNNCSAMISYDQDFDNLEIARKEP